MNCNLLSYGIKLSSVVHLFLLSLFSVIYFVTQDFGLQEVVVCNLTLIWLHLSHSGSDWSKIWFWPRSLWKSEYEIKSHTKMY